MLIKDIRNAQSDSERIAIELRKCLALAQTEDDRREAAELLGLAEGAARLLSRCASGLEASNL
jgi:hypothetical protein